MRIFRTLVNIDANLLNIFREIEKHFSIKLDKDIIQKIFKDAEENQVSEKEYLIFQAEKKLLRRQLIILGTVDEYEPETIRIEIQNIRDRDIKHFTYFNSISNFKANIL